MNGETRRFVGGYSAAALSGLLLAAAFPPFGCGFLAYGALVPLWLAVRASRGAHEAANLGAAAGLVFYSLSLHWLVKVFGWSAAAFWCVFALAPALHAALLRAAQDRAGRRPGLAADLFWVALAGVAWTGIEYFRAEAWPLECSWLALGYSQAGSLAALQSASVWGLYGLSGVIAAANAAAVLFIKGRRIPGELLLGAVALLLFFGERRAAELPVDRGREITVALVQDESYDLERLARRSLEPRVRGADLLVWPEYSFAVRPGREERYRKLVAKSLGTSRAVKVLGAAVFPEEKHERMRNFSWVLDADGRELGRYAKLHPIPYVERLLEPNPAPRPVDTPLGRLGLQICYDLDFEDGTRRMVRDGAELLVVTNLDPAEWGKWQHAQHSAMSAVRAVESGLWLVRAASSGTSQIIDPSGRVRARLPALESGVLYGTARLARGGTFYTAVGWLVGPLCMAAAGGLTLALLLVPALGYRRRKSSTFSWNALMSKGLARIGNPFSLTYSSVAASSGAPVTTRTSMASSSPSRSSVRRKS